MTGALVIRWGATIPGREAKALEVFGQAVERYEGYAKDGRIHGHREFIALTGRAGGFQLVEGEVEELQKILVAPETVTLNTKAESIVSDFEITLYGGGSDQSVQELIGSYAGALTDLGYM